MEYGAMLVLLSIISRSVLRTMYVLPRFRTTFDDRPSSQRLNYALSRCFGLMALTMALVVSTFKCLPD